MAQTQRLWGNMGLGQDSDQSQTWTQTWSESQSWTSRSEGTERSPRQTLFALVNQRLSAAAEDIFLLFEKTIAEYEREVLLLTRNNSQQQRPSSQQRQPTTGVTAVSQSEEVAGDTEDVKDTPGDSWDFDPQLGHSSFSSDASAERRAEPLEVKTEPELSLKQEDDLPFIITMMSEDEENQETKDRGRSQEAETREEDTSQRAELSCSSQPLPRPSSASLKRGYAKNRRFPCPHCAKRFVRNAELQRHILIHTGQRPFLCSVCGRSFRVVYQLQAHMRRHTGEKTCFCNVCNRGFRTKGLLTEHMRVHTGDKPFTCPVCNRGFTQRGNVVAHIRTHTGEKPFRCQFCNRCFTQKSTLDKHVVRHQREHHPGAHSLEF